MEPEAAEKQRRGTGESGERAVSAAKQGGGTMAFFGQKFRDFERQSVLQQVVELDHFWERLG